MQPTCYAAAREGSEPAKAVLIKHNTPAPQLGEAGGVGRTPSAWKLPIDNSPILIYNKSKWRYRNDRKKGNERQWRGA